MYNARVNQYLGVFRIDDDGKEVLHIVDKVNCILHLSHILFKLYCAILKLFPT